MVIDDQPVKVLESSVINGKSAQPGTILEATKTVFRLRPGRD
ncbi:hypothetical protein ACNKHO_20810 [Shigella flexneri]